MKPIKFLILIASTQILLSLSEDNLNFSLRITALNCTTFNKELKSASLIYSKKLFLQFIFRFQLQFCKMNKRLFLIISIIFCWPFLVIAQTKNLPYYLQQAKINSPLLSNYQNQIESIGWDSVKLKASYGPQVAANGNLTYAPVVHGWGYDNAITNGQNVSALMVVTKPIIGKNNLDTRLQSFRINKDITANQSKLSEKALAQSITQQYITSYGSQQQLALANEILSFLKKEDTTLRKLARSSVFRQTDYLAFKVSLQQQQLVKDQLMTQALNELGNLNYLCGLQDSSFQNLQSPAMQITNEFSFDSSAYAKTYRLDSLKNSNDAKIIGLNYKPTVSAFADGGYQSSLVDLPYKNLGASVGLNFSLPIYDGKQKRASLMQNKLLEDSRQKQRDFAKQQYQQKVLQLQQQIQQYEELIRQGEQQMKYTKTLIDAEKQQLETGDVRMTDYLLSIHNYLDLRTGIIQNNLSRMLLIAQLNNLILL